MKKTWLVCLVLLVGGCVKSEDLYQSRPIGYWLKELKHPDAAARWRAAVAVKEIGHTMPKRSVAALTEALTDGDYIVRKVAADALTKFGSQATVAIPNLREMAAKDSETICREAAQKALQLLEASQSDPK